jgi:hypothetical protein
VPQEQILLLPLLASKGGYPLPTCFLAVTECLVVAKHHCLEVRIINRLRHVLQQLQARCCRARSWVLLGRIITRTSNKLFKLHESSAVSKPKRKNRASQRLFGSILSRVLSRKAGVRAVLANRQAPQADKIRSRGSFVAIPMKKIRAPLCPLNGGARRSGS